MNPDIERLNRSRRDKLDWAARLGLGPLSAGGAATGPAPPVRMPRMGMDSPENSEEEEEERRKSEQRLVNMRKRMGTTGQGQPAAVPPPAEDEEMDGSGFFAAPVVKKKPPAEKKSVLDLRITTTTIPTLARAFPQPGAGAANDIFDDRPKDDDEEEKRPADDDSDDDDPRDEQRGRGRSRSRSYDRSRSRGDRRRRYDDDVDSSEERRKRKREDRRKREEWRKQYAKMKEEEERMNRKKKLAAKFDAGGEPAEGRGVEDDVSGSDSEDDEQRARFKDAKATERERALVGEAPINPPAQYEPLQRKYVGQLRDSEIDERLRQAEENQRRSGQKLMTEAEVMAMMKMGAKRRR